MMMMMMMMMMMIMIMIMIMIMMMMTREESAETISFLTTTNIIHRFWRHSQAPLIQKYCATF